MFYSLENGEKVFSKIISEGVGVFQFFVVLLFEKEVPLGMCEVSLFKISNSVQKLLQDEIEMIPP
jgi:hypothetical protein